MEEGYRGRFTGNMLSIQMQLAALFEEVGGTPALKFLDSIAKLPTKTQKVVLSSLRNVIERLHGSNVDLLSAHDLEAANFEQALFDGLLADLEVEKHGKQIQTRSDRRLTLVPGGRQTEKEAAKIGIVSSERSL